MKMKAFILILFSIIITRERADEVSQLSSRLYVADTKNRWPNSTIYYDVDPYINSNRFMRTSIREAIDYLNRQSCFKWKQRYPWQDLPYVVTFLLYEDTQKMQRCSTNMSFIKEPQHFLFLGRHCYKCLRNEFAAYRLVDPYLIYPTLHEMTQVMGLAPEQQRPDRDCYIWVDDTVPYHAGWKKNNWWNLKYDFPYDYQSITHYPAPRNLAHPHDPKNGLTVGRTNGTLSDLDVWKIKHLYCNVPTYCETYRNQCEATAAANKNNPNCTRFGNI